MSKIYPDSFEFQKNLKIMIFQPVILDLRRLKNEKFPEIRLRDARKLFDADSFYVGKIFLSQA